MNKQKIMTVYIAFATLLTTTISNTIAAPTEPTLLMYFSEVLRFNTEKVEAIEFSGSSENSGTFSQIKPKDENITTRKEITNNVTNSSRSTSFSMSSEFIKSQNAYKLTLIDSTGGGILISDTSLEQAPANGYISSVECLIPLHDKAYEAVRYIYLKTKTDDKEVPYKYTRLELDMTVGKVKLIVDMTAVTNPDGSGNLKEDPVALQKYLNQRISEIDKAMKNDTVTNEQIEELQELRKMQMQGTQSTLNRWDFNGNRRQIIQQKRERLLEADGRLRTQESVPEDHTQTSSNQ